MANTGKGSSFEREIAKRLGLWWTGGERDDIFWRTSQSGGRATTRKKTGKTTANQDGDICATDPIGQPLIDAVTIELKCGYNSWNIKQIIDSISRKKETILEAFFNQASRECAAQNRGGWWLITRQDRRNALIFVNGDFFKQMRKRVQIPDEAVYIVIFHCRYGLIACFELELFLNLVTPEFFKC